MSLYPFSQCVGASVAQCDSRAQKVSSYPLLPARSPAAPRHAPRTRLLTERRTCRRLRPSGARFILSNNDRVAFLKVSRDDLGYPAIGQTRSNPAGLNCFVRGKDPDGLPLPSWTATLATGGSLSTLAALTSLPLTLARPSLTAVALGMLALTARSLSPAASLTGTCSVAVALAAFASLTETFTIAGGLAAFAPLTETFLVAVVLGSFTSLTPGFAIEVPLATLASLTETLVVAVALAGFTSLPPGFAVEVALGASGCLA